MESLATVVLDLANTQYLDICSSPVCTSEAGIKLAFICSKSTIEILEKGVKCVQS